MTALPDTVMPDGPPRQQHIYHPAEDDCEGGRDPLMRSALRCLGAGAVVAAFGVWLMPSMPGDAAMQLIKLLMSVVLLAAGAILLSVRAGAAGPEIHIDTRARRLTILHQGADGRMRAEVAHDIDALSEVVLRDRLLTARDADGRALFALTIDNPQAERAIRAMLRGAGAPARAA